MNLKVSFLSQSHVKNSGLRLTISDEVQLTS